MKTKHPGPAVITLRAISLLFALGGGALLCGCASGGDNRPIPGTVGSTDSKNSENNTPRVNPTPNPDPESQPGDGPR
jgi:hypothetical protein